MQIWVDADACPKVIKEILYRAAMRRQLPLILVSNHALSTPASPYIFKLQVERGFDVADQKILDKIIEGDLVVTADIPLANLVLQKGARALNPRGLLYTLENIKERLAMRDFSTNLRNSGVQTGGPSVLSKREIQNFANQLDRLLVC